MSLYRIPMFKLAVVERKIKKLNDRAAKLGVEPVTYTLSEPYLYIYQDPNKENVMRSIELVNLDLFNSIVSLNGYRFLATLEPIDKDGNNLIQKIDFDFDVPEKYRTSGTTCEHCKVKRYRNKCYLVVNDEEKKIVQVGSTCISNYLGFDASFLVSHASFIEGMSDFMEFDPSGYTDREIGRNTQWGFGVFEFLKTTYKWIQAYGYVSGSKAYKEGILSTGSHVFDLLCTPYSKIDTERKTVLNTPVDDGLIEKIQVWMIALGDKPNKSDYEHNLSVIAKSDFVTSKGANWVASAIYGYQRAMNLLKEKEERKVSEYIGTVGQRTEFVAKLRFLKRLDGGMYGPKDLLVFVTPEGNEVTAFYSGTKAVEQDASYRIRAMVKKHNEYNGVKQTIINRPTFVKVE